jgi:hypothetical protein
MTSVEDNADSVAADEIDSTDIVEEDSVVIVIEETKLSEKIKPVVDKTAELGSAFGGKMKSFGGGISKSAKRMKDKLKSSTSSAKESISSKMSPSPKSTASSTENQGYATPQPIELEELTVAMLREMLKIQGMKVSGTKSELIERLKSSQIIPSSEIEVKPKQPENDLPELSQATSPTSQNEVHSESHSEESAESEPSPQKLLETSTPEPEEKKRIAKDKKKTSERIRELESTLGPQLKSGLSTAYKKGLIPVSISLLFILSGLITIGYAALLFAVVKPELFSGLGIDWLIDLKFLLPGTLAGSNTAPLDQNTTTLLSKVICVCLLFGGVLIFLQSEKGVMLCCAILVGGNVILRFIPIMFSSEYILSESAMVLSIDLFKGIIFCYIVYIPFFMFPKGAFNTSRKIGPFEIIIGDKSITGDISNNTPLVDESEESVYSMDIRNEIDKPDLPRPRAKLEFYEKLLLFLGVMPMWPIAIAITGFSGNNKSIPWVDDFVVSEQLVAVVWLATLLLTLIVYRLDKSARDDGMYSKEKETYMELMDQYKAAQAKYSEYIELKAEAGKMDILAKYPDLKNNDSSTSTSS